MPLRKRNVKIKLPEMLPDQIIKITLVNWSAYAEFVLPPNTKEIPTNGAGEAVVSLWASGDGLSATYYRVQLPSNLDPNKNPPQFFNLIYGDGSDIDLSSLLIADVPVATGEPLYNFVTATVAAQVAAAAALKQDKITTYNPDKPESAPNAFDDDFLILNPVYSQINLTFDRIAANKSILQITPPVALGISLIERALPVGITALAAKVLKNRQMTANAGICVRGGGNARFLLSIKSTTIVLEKWIGQTFDSAPASFDTVGFLINQSIWFYQKAVKTGVNLWSFYVSANGIEWFAVIENLNVTAEAAGLGLAGSSGGGIGYFDWIKFYTGGDILIIGG